MVTEREKKVIIAVLVLLGLILLWAFSEPFRSRLGEGVVVKIGMWKAHETPIVRMAVSVDGKRLATVGKDKVIKVWDVDRRSLLATFEGHQERVTCLAFSPDASRLVSGSVDQTVRVWSLMTGQQERVFSPETTEDWHSGWIEAVAISPDGNILATGGRDTAVKLWDLSSGKPLATLWGHQDTVTSLAFSKAEPHFLASGSTDGAIWIWDVKKAEPYLQIPPHGLNPQSIVFSPDGKYLVVGSYATAGVRILDWRKAKVLKWCDGVVEGTVWEVTYSPDGRLIAAGSGDNGLWLWSSPSGHWIRTIKDEYWGDVRGVAFTDNGKVVIGAFEDGTVRLWRITGLRIHIPAPKLPSVPGGEEHAH